MSGLRLSEFKNKNVNTAARNPLPLLATPKINDSVHLFVFPGVKIKKFSPHNFLNHPGLRFLSNQWLSHTLDTTGWVLLMYFQIDDSEGSMSEKLWDLPLPSSGDGPN